MVIISSNNFYNLELDNIEAFKNIHDEFLEITK